MGFTEGASEKVYLSNQTGFYDHGSIAANTTLGIRCCDNELWVEGGMTKIMDLIIQVLSTSHTMETREASPNAGPFNVRM